MSEPTGEMNGSRQSAIKRLVDARDRLQARANEIQELITYIERNGDLTQPADEALWLLVCEARGL